MNLLTVLWHRRQRKIDLNILWPAIRDQAGDLDHARAAFRAHMDIDTAWLSFDEEQKREFLNELK